ncbi:hypothetical protein D9758_016410 [Tetrapyrgos nigripes]|uniref:DDE-1 domain-containing protein n=1 Tax=Tetrapyrgos nigripes TaxID=182062 RepID=A0A8H5FPS4_9AGAR|nr:hypothetical protein D9758_016410 [Tetrapyrgos nigripes]
MQCWTSSELMIDWLINHFDPQTREKAQGRHRALFMDGHSFHFMEPVIAFALENDIVIIGYPPHCTHALQGLDIVCFAKFKAQLKKAVVNFEEQHGQAVSKADFMGVFGTAFNELFDSDTIRAAWKATGLHPFDPSVIKPEQMKPAEAHSSIPLPLLIAKEKECMEEPNWNLINMSSDPVQYTRKEPMGRQIGQLTIALSEAKTLVDVHRENEEAWAAQAVLQDLQLKKMKRVIVAQEERKKDKGDKDNTSLPGPSEGYGRIWSAEDILELKRKKWEGEEQEAREKKERVKNKEDMKIKKAAFEAEWKKIIEGHKRAVDKWNEECRQLKENGAKKKDWPRKPTHISKKDLSVKWFGTSKKSSQEVVGDDKGATGGEGDKESNKEDEPVDVQNDFDED